MLGQPLEQVGEIAQPHRVGQGQAQTQRLEARRAVGGRVVARAQLAEHDGAEVGAVASVERDDAFDQAVVAAVDADLPAALGLLEMPAVAGKAAGGEGRIAPTGGAVGADRLDLEAVGLDPVEVEEGHAHIEEAAQQAERRGQLGAGLAQQTGRDLRMLWHACRIIHDHATASIAGLRRSASMASMTLTDPAPAACTFALFLGNRGFFPSSCIAAARTELVAALAAGGHRALIAPEDGMRHGAVETAAEGRAWARWFAAHRHEVDGVILCLPNFGDENGAVAAMQDAGVPILVHAYPDELTQMAPATRRDAFCGKMSVMDVFRQVGIRFTALKPHVVHPASAAFQANLAHFAAVCRVVKGLRRCTIGAIGARTTAFKTVRVDEVALQSVGVTVEATDLADVMARVRALADQDGDVLAKAERLRGYTDFTQVPGRPFLALCKLGVALDQISQELGCDAIALRCWIELQKELGISPCVLLSELNDRGLPAACEVDVGNAVVMRALKAATGGQTTLLDWNNNYGDDPDRVILFHCGPVPQGLMLGRGTVTDHVLLQPVLGEGCSYGCNTGRIRPFDFTYGGLVTDRGRVEVYLGEGAFTADPVPADFFGCAGVARIPDLQEVLLTIARQGHRHHVALAPGRARDAMVEAMGGYLGYSVTRFA